MQRQKVTHGDDDKDDEDDDGEEAAEGRRQRAADVGGPGAGWVNGGECEVRAAVLEMQ